MNKLRIVQLKKDTTCSLCGRDLRTGWTVAVGADNSIYCLGSCAMLYGMGIEVTPLTKTETGTNPF